MSISELTLFVSTSSEASRKCISYVRSSGIQVNIVRLDHPQARQMAMNGPHFQVKEVPTLVVLFVEGNLKMFVGAPKVLQCLQMISGPPPVEEEEQTEIVEEEAPPPPPPKRRPPAKTQPRVVEEDDGDIVQAEEEEEPLPPPKKVPKAKKVKKPKKPKSKKAADVELEFLSAGDEEEEATLREPPPSQQHMNAPKNGKTNKSLMEMAKEMERAREQQLGYNEKDLPRSTG